VGWLSFLYPPLGYRLFPIIAVLGLLGQQRNPVAPRVRRERTTIGRNRPAQQVCREGNDMLAHQDGIAFGRSLGGSPKGCEIVAGGPQTTGTRAIDRRTLRGAGEHA